MGNYQLKKPDSIKKRKRVGCGPSSGAGKTCGRGHNGQLSRSGSKKRAWFEGGQMPLIRRVPKRGFQNHFKKNYQLVNLSTIDKLSENEITPELLMEKGIINKSDELIKILANGNISKSVKVTADAFTKSTIEKIQGAGGEAIIRNTSSQNEK